MADTRTCEAVGPLARNPLFNIVNFVVEELVDQLHSPAVVSLRKVPPAVGRHHLQILQFILPSPNKSKG
jgi:hypothetical protein